MELKVIFVGNNTLVGRYEEETKVLHEPRSIILGTDPQGKTMVGMQTILGGPDSLQILNPSLMYDLKDEEIVNLYIKSTTGIIPAKNLDNVRPIGHRNN